MENQPSNNYKLYALLAQCSHIIATNLDSPASAHDLMREICAKIAEFKDPVHEAFIASRNNLAINLATIAQRFPSIILPAHWTHILHVAPTMDMMNTVWDYCAPQWAPLDFTDLMLANKIDHISRQDILTMMNRAGLNTDNFAQTLAIAEQLRDHHAPRNSYELSPNSREVMEEYETRRIARDYAKWSAMEPTITVIAKHGSLGDICLALETVDPHSYASFLLLHTLRSRANVHSGARAKFIELLCDPDSLYFDEANAQAMRDFDQYEPYLAQNREELISRQIIGMIKISNPSQHVAQFAASLRQSDDIRRAYCDEHMVEAISSVRSQEHLHKFAQIFAPITIRDRFRIIFDVLNVRQSRLCTYHLKVDTHMIFNFLMQEP